MKLRPPQGLNVAFFVLLFFPWAATTTCNFAEGADWPNWRGPGMQGVASPGEYPVKWSPQENVAWRLVLPGRGSSTPIVVGPHIYLTSEDAGHNAILCIDRDGKVVWKTEAGDAIAGKHRKGTGANPSVVCDGLHVFAMFKSGELVGLNCADGKILWQHNLHTDIAKDTLWWDLGASPVYAEGQVIVTCQQSGPSYIAAFSPENGKLLWKHDRLLPAPNESSQSYTTPIVVKSGDEEILVVAGADHVTGHSLRGGTELWRVGGLNPEQHEMFRSIASPVADGDLVFAPYARGATLTAVRLGGHGDVTDSHVAWTNSTISSDVPTPAAKDGKIYICQDKGTISCLDGKTGEPIWQKTLGSSREAFSASPILAGDRLYVTREDGVTFVLDTARQGEVLAENSIGEAMVATPVLVDGEILLRTFESLICIQHKS